jgi:hypothetical protein
MIEQRTSPALRIVPADFVPSASTAVRVATAAGASHTSRGPAAVVLSGARASTEVSGGTAAVLLAPRRSLRLTGATRRGATVVVEPLSEPRLLSTSFSRSATNRRHLRVRVRVPHRSTISVHVTRDGQNLGFAKVGPVAAGSRCVSVPIARSALGGAADLAITVADQHQHVRTMTGTVVAPKRVLS